MKNILLLFLVLSISGITLAQDILLDEPIRAGELTLFPSLRKANEYRYVSDKPKLALHPDGRPQFSFIRYVTNTTSAGLDDTAVSSGGGIIHAVIEMGVTEEQLEEARDALRDINPSGKIMGAVPYTSGSMALVSSLNDTTGGFSKRVLGVGKAPLLDGQRAAVSIQLTKLGAQVLWESFQTPTPDMSFSFEMRVEGYRSPQNARIEADFERIYKHRDFQGGLVRNGGVMLGAEIHSTFEELTDNKAIKVTNIDGDADMQKATDAAYTKLTTLMFNESGSNVGTPAMPALPGANDQGILQRTQAFLAQGRRDALEDIGLQEKQNPLEPPKDVEQPTNNNRRDTTTATRDTTSRSTTLRDSTARDTSAGSPAGQGGAAPRPLTLTDDELPIPVPTPTSTYQRPRPTLPTAAMLLSYKMREKRQTGKYVIDLNKYTKTHTSLRFDQNVGPINCRDCFQQFNIDDPLYQQREIAAILDGFNSADFTKTLNFVSVAFRKTHQNGATTEGDIRIDQRKFNAAGNNFKFGYGWKGDTERAGWRDYEYQTIWSFMGGATVKQDWETTDVNTVPLSPPYRLKTINVEAAPADLAERDVRSAQVDVYFTVNGKELTRQAVIRSRDTLSIQTIDILEPADWLEQDPGYEYTVTWRKGDGTEEVSARKTSTSPDIYADAL